MRGFVGDDVSFARLARARIRAPPGAHPGLPGLLPTLLSVEEGSPADPDSRRLFRNLSGNP